jgi:hypothetical protein
MEGNYPCEPQFFAYAATFSTQSTSSLTTFAGLPATTQYPVSNRFVTTLQHPTIVLSANPAFFR